MTQRRKTLAQFEAASPVALKGEYDLRRNPVLIVSSRNANFIRRLCAELRELEISSELQVVNDEASVYVMPQSSGKAFALLTEVQSLFRNWRGRKSRGRAYLKIGQVCITLTLILVAGVWLFRTPLYVSAILATWFLLLFLGEQLYRRKTWEGVCTFSLRESLFVVTLIAVVLMLWRFAAIS